MARRRRKKNPKIYVRNTLIGAGIGAAINYVWKYWISPPGVNVPAALPEEGAFYNGSVLVSEVLLPGAVTGGIAGMAYTGATK